MKRRLLAALLMLALIWSLPAMAEAQSMEDDPPESASYAEAAVEEPVEAVEQELGDASEVLVVEDDVDETEPFIEPEPVAEDDEIDEPVIDEYEEEEPYAEPARGGESQESVDPRDCQHPVTVTVIDRDAKGICYEDLKDGTHRITGRSVLAVVCTDCGMAVERVDEYVEKCDYTASVCRWCGHVKGDDGRHVHEFTGEYHEFTGDLQEVVPDPDAPELYHISRYQLTRARKCAQCDAYETAEAVPGETIDKRERHNWDASGVCPDCGAVRDCRHDGGTIENVWSTDEGYAFVNASVHEYTALRWVQRCCAICGEPLESATTRRVSERQSHHFVDGGCVDCGYVNVCDHPNMVYSYACDEDAIYIPLDGLKHRAMGGGVYIEGERCPDCGFEQTGLHLQATASEMAVMAHRFDENGVCVDCGYTARATQSACTHPEESRITLDATDAEALKRHFHYTVDEALSTETEHVLRVDYDPSWVCGLCGYREDLSGETRQITVTEAHCFQKGYCVTANCGYRCPHARVIGEAEKGEPFYEYVDASGHYPVTPTVSTGRCELCGEYVKNHIVDKTPGELEPHDMRDGVCRVCGYACPHPSADVAKLLPIERTVCVPVDAGTHVLRRERVTETICKDCGYTLFESTSIISETSESHDIKNGVCVVCGYLPAVDEAGAGEADYVQLPADVRVNGVAAEDELDMVETAVQVGRHLQADVDSGRTEVVIEGLYEAFTEDEMERLAGLPLSEQLLVAQCFLGFRDDVCEAVAKEPSLLGNMARTLIDRIQRRIDAMNPSERASLEAALREGFPLTDFEVTPGTTTEVLNIDLTVSVDGRVTRDRYSFQNSGSKWVLINIAAQ